MQTPNGDSDVYIVRIWREASERIERPPWRGQVEHLPSSRKTGFVRLRALCWFIARTAGIDGAADGDEDMNGPGGSRAEDAR